LLEIFRANDISTRDLGYIVNDVTKELEIDLRLDKQENGNFWDRPITVEDINEQFDKLIVDVDHPEKPLIEASPE
jgi:hypothetical protein